MQVLVWPPFDYKQTTINWHWWSWWKGFWQGYKAGVELVGGCGPIVWVDASSNEKIEKVISLGLRWSPIKDSAHNNQPKTCGHGGLGIQEEVQPGVSVQGVIPLFLGQ